MVRHTNSNPDRMLRLKRWEFALWLDKSQHISVHALARLSHSVLIVAKKVHLFLLVKDWMASRYPDNNCFWRGSFPIRRSAQISYTWILQIYPWQWTIKSSSQIFYWLVSSIFMFLMHRIARTIQRVAVASQERGRRWKLNRRLEF
jgi:hypothetical protein